MNEQPKIKFYKRHWFLVAVLVSAVIWFVISGFLTHWQFPQSPM